MKKQQEQLVNLLTEFGNFLEARVRPEFQRVFIARQHPESSARYLALWINEEAVRNIFCEKHLAHFFQDKRVLGSLRECLQIVFKSLQKLVKSNINIG